MTKIKGKFSFKIGLFQNSNGSIWWDSAVVAEDIPDELVIMQLKAFVRQIENKYFDNFDKNHPNSLSL